ncbi:hypothetical protein E2C01_059996 [Portunus trituberculatus]|uniref:Uncharacterized protein n=1 Tax=Portunus trituberculatus TaxID=210409 RepID=A0A5B7H7P4_PORTR|nr:hypothetical protein [Portunus trituberculatus]
MCALCTAKTHLLFPYGDYSRQTPPLPVLPPPSSGHQPAVSFYNFKCGVKCLASGPPHDLITPDPKDSPDRCRERLLLWVDNACQGATGSRSAGSERCGVTAVHTSVTYDQS